MNQTLRRWLQPMPTSPRPPQGIKLHDRRSVGKQVDGGFRIAGWMVGGFVLVAFLGRGLINLHAGNISIGICELCVSIVVLFLTVHRWARVIAGSIFIPAIGNGVTSLISGEGPYYPHAPIARPQMAELLVYVVGVVALTWRFVGFTPTFRRIRPAMTTLLDRVSLTLFVVFTLNQMTVPYSFPPLSLTLGVLALMSAWVAYRWNKSKGYETNHRNRHAEAAIQTNLGASRNPPVEP